MASSTKRKQLKKHAATVHSSGELTLIQRKICNALLYKAFPNLQHMDVHEISIRELIDLIGFSSNNHAVLKKSFKALLGAVFEWNLLGEQGEEDWTGSALLASARISGSRCFYSYSAHLRELLYMPTVYASIDILTQSRFRSVYGLVLYENCVRYRNIKHTKWLPIDLFRRLMGIPEDKYTVFRDLKRRVIDVAVYEVNAYSDISIEPEYEKSGRSIAKIRFHLKERGISLETDQDTEPLIQAPPAYNEVLVANMVKKVGISRGAAIKLCKLYPEELILEKVEFVCASDSFARGEIKNLPAFFTAALKNDFINTKSNKTLLVEQQEAARQLEMDQARLAKQLQARQREYDAYTSQFLKKKLDQADLPQIRGIFTDQLQRNNDTVMLGIYEKKGLDSPMVWGTFKQFLAIEFPHFFEGITSFDDFLLLEATNILGVEV